MLNCNYFISEDIKVASSCCLSILQTFLFRDRRYKEYDLYCRICLSLTNSLSTSLWQHILPFDRIDIVSLSFSLFSVYFYVSLESFIEIFMRLLPNHIQFKKSIIFRVKYWKVATLIKQVRVIHQSNSISII